MRRTLWPTVSSAVLLALVAGCGAESTGATGGSGGSAAKRVELEGTSWDVAVVTTVTKANPNFTPAQCNEFSLSLRVEEDTAGPSLLLARNGVARRTALRATEDGYELAEGDLSLPIHDACLGDDRLWVSKLSLRGVDADGNGAAETLSASGEGFVDADFLIPYEHEADFSLSGARDATLPVLLLPQSEFPLDGLRVDVSEPLQAGATLALEGTSPLTLTPTIVEEAGVIMGFNTLEVLPFGGSWTTVATGSDFAGHALTAHAELRTLADPGIFAEDGFEGEVAAAPAAAVQVVEGVGVLPAISGKRSLWVTVPAVTLHLKRTPGQTKLRARAQWFYRAAELAPVPSISVGVVGSSKRTFAATNAETPTLLSGDSVYASATGISELTVPLEGDGPDVIVGIKGWEGCWGRCTTDAKRPGGVLLDDLRLE